MSETVVHVDTLEQWKSVLDVWFEQGYKWKIFDRGEYLENIFHYGNHYLFLINDVIAQSLDNQNRTFIEYADFMAQQEKKMTTYEVTQEQFDLIEHLKKSNWALDNLINDETGSYKPLVHDLEKLESNAILRYIGGDETIEFKVKEQLYRLWRVDSDDNTIYMRINYLGTPGWTEISKDAFTAPLEEIKKWKTPAWDVEEAD